jgi:hypothetical protein
MSNEEQNRNDQRSNDKNPNNPTHQQAMDNHSNQLNPNHTEYKGNGTKNTN